MGVFSTRLKSCPDTKPRPGYSNWNSPLKRIFLHLNALLGYGAAEFGRIRGRVAGQAAQNGELSAQRIAFRAGCQNAPGRLLGLGHSFLGEEAGHGRGGGG